MIRLGSTILSNHLYVVISDPAKHDGKCVIVNVTTQRAISDTTCVLQPGEHPFLKHNSVINYEDAIKTSAAAIEMSLKKGLVCSHSDMPSKVLERIIAGAKNGDSFPVRLKKYLS